MKFENIKHSWSKYGPGRGKSTHGTDIPTEDWCCQICGKLQKLGTRVNFYSLSNNEYLKLCDACFDTARSQNEANHQKVIYQTILSTRIFDSTYEYLKEVEMLTTI